MFHAVSFFNILIRTFTLSFHETEEIYQSKSVVNDYAHFIMHIYYIERW